MNVRIVSPHVKKLSGSLETDREGHLVRVLIVETGLCLDATSPSYDAKSVDELVANIQAKMGDLYDRAVFKQVNDA